MPHFTSSDGLSLYYEDEGAGLPILCLSGLTRNVRDFDHVAPQILQGHRMIRMDYRGRGQSDYAEDFATYSLPREAQDALELLDHLGIKQVGLLGTSRGGLIAMGLAATAKDRLLGVAMNDIGPVLEPAGLDMIMTYLGRRPAAPDIDSLIQLRAALTAEQFPNVPLEKWRHEISHNYTQGDGRVELNYDAKLRDAVLAGGADGAVDLWPFFEAIAPLPCALFHGVNSDLLTAETVTEMARRMPALRVASVADRGHIPFLDEPESQAVLADWLADLDEAAA
ncbi:alpha/beta fold hydrolase [Thalassovita mediterranea]|jgi:pimeloyl-ACP methyl ester carboxylesterase|uniref:Haloacetate dehalogenase H-1 n=1 Tax=Thalassovita mediterranea TaxID=340021 RepID=A0A0P1H3I7_9RHOB|nr:alpha/beta hydrolase [Thalassovita mediterranea]CUH84269.1 Haloacetate dehalogenase H-1 [Thalassovita mediterranea]SIS27510.1 Pimeloyl-ACP methyl ester carboxylesterase [Thalassovita mediterranea]